MPYRQLVPCGKCKLCLNSKRMNWLMRVEQEQKYTQLPNSYFLTLTYNEKKVPRKKGVRTLYKRHPQLFFKRLRKQGHKIKYILVGEYGKTTQRPHYHAICWTTALPRDIDKAWQYGHVHYRDVSRETTLYTLKYILNPRQGDNEIKQREYAVFSKGIGLSYLTNAMYEYHTRNYLNPRFTAFIDGRIVPLPRYYRNKIFTKHQLAEHARKMYYESLKKRMRGIRELKKLGYKHPWKAWKQKKLRKAEKVKVKHNETL